MLLIPILLPPALLLQVFYNKNLDRNAKYDLLNIGAAIIFIHVVSLSNNKTPLDKNENLPINGQALNKYLLLAASLAPLFLDPRPFDLADCTSHLLEHFFGLIRRFASGNDTKEKFEECIQKAICLSDFLPKLGIDNKISGRHGQDSGAIVQEGELCQMLKETKFGHYVKGAWNLMSYIFHNSGHNLETILPSLYNDIKNFEDYIFIDIQHMNFPSFFKSPHTAKQSNDILSSGLSKIPYYIQMQQMNSYLKENDLEKSDSDDD